MNKAEATEIYEKYKGRKLCYVKVEDINVPSEFEPIISIVGFSKEDFHKLWAPGGDTFLPKKPLVDRIGEAAGIEFQGESSKIERTDTGYVVGHVGRRMKPDGEWRSSGLCLYEFDYMDRAELDFIADEEKTMKKGSSSRYGNDISKRKHQMELKKVALARADSGASLRVIKKIIGLNMSFSLAEVNEGEIIVSQIVKSAGWKNQFIGKLMETTDGRQLVAESILGSKEVLYGKQDEKPVKIGLKGPEKTALPEPEQPNKPEVHEGPVFDESELEKEPPTDKKKFLSEWYVSNKESLVASIVKYAVEKYDPLIDKVYDYVTTDYVSSSLQQIDKLKRLITLYSEVPEVRKYKPGSGPSALDAVKNAIGIESVIDVTGIKDVIKKLDSLLK